MVLQPGRFFSIESLDHDKIEGMKEGVQKAREEAESYADLKERVNQARMRGGAAAADSPGNIYYRTYACKDGYIAVGNLSAALRAKFQTAMGIEDPRYSGDPEIAPATERGREIGRKLVEVCEAKFLDHTVAEWMSYLDACGVPAGPVLFPEELWDDEQVKANGLIVEVEHETFGRVKMAGPPIAFSDTPTEVGPASPVLGRHTDEVLSEVGYSAAELSALRADGVIR
jgi:crotonobetainyl-CoA:carnitine CoA-transferase CaiB-like acyl-CoA transferase